MLTYLLLLCINSLYDVINNAGINIDVLMHDFTWFIFFLFLFLLFWFFFFRFLFFFLCLHPWKYLSLINGIKPRDQYLGLTPRASSRIGPLTS